MTGRRKAVLATGALQLAAIRTVRPRALVLDAICFGDFRRMAGATKAARLFGKTYFICWAQMKKKTNHQYWMTDGCYCCVPPACA